MIKSVVFDFNGVILDSNTHRINDDMLDLVRDLYESDFNLCLFSNTATYAINVLDAKYDFLKYFKNVVLVEDTGLSKPSDEAFKNLLKVIEVPAEEIVCIDDGRDNLRQAKKYGMHPILFVGVDRLRVSLASLDI